MRRLYRRDTVLTGVVVVAALVGLGAGDDPKPVYEVAVLKGKLVREEPAPKVALEVGARPAAGELLRTGWRSSAEILAPEAGARFKLGPSSRARLAGQRPGLLLELQRGRIHALFDKLEGEPPPERLVTTPSAVLAVRGTEYGAAVARSGDTEVVVFSGQVEVQDLEGRAEPVAVPAGHACTVRRGRTPGVPRPLPMSPADWDRGQRPQSEAGQGAGSPGEPRGAPGAGDGMPAGAGARRPPGSGGRRGG